MRRVLISDVENKKAHAGYKARFDVMKIAMSNNMIISYVTADHRGRTLKGIIERVSSCLNLAKSLKKDDVVFFNYPNNNIYTEFLLLLRSFMNIKLIAIIHDLDSLRNLKNKDNKYLPQFDGLISHNDVMSDYLMKITTKTVKSLGIFDYIVAYPKIDGESIVDSSVREIVYVGNLTYQKSSFIYNYAGKLDAWGNGFDSLRVKNNELTHKGVFDPNEPSAVFHEYKDKIAFGLVWDGESSDTCSGVYGAYLAYNNPHKTSFYLSQDIPVLIWENAALSSFVVENACGIVIKNMQDAKNVVDNISPEEYVKLKENARIVGQKVRNGEYLLGAMGRFYNNEKE